MQMWLHRHCFSALCLLVIHPRKLLKLCRLWYNTKYVGLNFKLDVGLYRLDSQVACQRYRQNSIVAKTTELKQNLLARFGNFQMPAAVPVAA